MKQQDINEIKELLIDAKYEFDPAFLTNETKQLRNRIDAMIAKLDQQKSDGWNKISNVGNPTESGLYDIYDGAVYMGEYNVDMDLWINDIYSIPDITYWRSRPQPPVIQEG